MWKHLEIAQPHALSVCSGNYRAMQQYRTYYMWALQNKIKQKNKVPNWIRVRVVSGSELLLISGLSQSYPRVVSGISGLSQICLRFVSVISGLSQSYPRVVSELSQGCLRVIPGLSQSYLRFVSVISGLSQSYPRVVSELSQLSQGCLRVTSDLSQLSRGCLRIISDLSQLSQGCLRVISDLSQLSQGCLRVIPGLSQSYLRFVLVISELSQICLSYLRVVSELSQGCLRVISGLSQNYLSISNLNRSQSDTFFGPHRGASLLQICCRSVLAWTAPRPWCLWNDAPSSAALTGLKLCLLGDRCAALSQQLNADEGFNDNNIKYLPP